VKLKVLALSDVVNTKLYSPYIEEYKDKVDLVISCGDLPIYYLDFIATSLGKPLFFVCGNHDHYDLKTKNMVFIQDKILKMNYEEKNVKMGGINLDGKVEVFSGVIFAGIEGSMLYNRGEHQYTEMQIKRKILKLKPRLWLNKLFYGRYIDVIVTHAPPFGIHDRSDLPHKGFLSFLNFIKKYSPAYLLHGHSHIYDNREERITKVENTMVVNCYDYVLIDIEI
jgi:Icc-related predicted phosphoesterase